MGKGDRETGSFAWHPAQKKILLIAALIFFFNSGKSTYHESYPFNKILSVQYSIVDYRYDVVQKISRTYLV